MKYCLPIVSDEGLNSRLSDAFETTNLYLIYNTESGSTQIFDDSAPGSAGVMSEILAGGVDAIIAPSLRMSAFGVLKKRTKVKLLKGLSGTCQDNINGIGELSELCESDLEKPAGGCASGLCATCSSKCGS